jgi:hypothetical protein
VLQIRFADRVADHFRTAAWRVVRLVGQEAILHLFRLQGGDLPEPGPPPGWSHHQRSQMSVADASAPDRNQQAKKAKGRRGL